MKNTITESKILVGYAVSNKCIGCGHCVDMCPAGAIDSRRKPVYINQEKCRKCGTCATVCFNKAIVKIG